MVTKFKPGDLVWITAGLKANPVEGLDYALRGVIMSKIGEDWFRIYSTYHSHAGEVRTKIQDLPDHMLKRIYADGGR